MLQLCFQYYPIPLEDLTSAEKVVIVKALLIITILKLRPNNNFKPKIYRGIYGHSIFLPQNPGLLLILLPLEITSMDNVMQVV